MRHTSGQPQRAHGYAYGISAVTADSSINCTVPLTTERFHQWHRWLFPIPVPNVSVARFRDDRLGPMQVVSAGPTGRNPTVHFEAPAAHRVESEINRFLHWFYGPEPATDLREPALPTFG